VHRVRVGPYNRVEDMNAARAELARAGMESSLVRVKP
jgi:cell division protein FtsN